jgi:hypothetical protein
MPARATLRESGTPFLARSRGGNTQTSTPEPLSPAGHDPAEREVCIANISPRERLRRLIGGVIPLVIALVILTWQISMGLDRLWRLPLFLLFAAGAAGFFQWRDKT